MDDRAGREIEAATLESEIAQVCGVVNAAPGRLVSLIARLGDRVVAGMGRPLRVALGGVEMRRVRHFNEPARAPMAGLTV